MQARIVARALREAGETLPREAAAPGDEAALRRGVPIVGRGCSGAIRGSQPGRY